MNNKTTEDELKNYEELIDMDKKCNNLEQDKLNKLFSNKKRIIQSLKKLKLKKVIIIILILLFILIIFGYILFKSFFGNNVKLKLIKVKNKQEISQVAGDIIIDIINKNPNPKISLTSGSLAKRIYKYLIDKYEDNDISFLNTIFFSLDDYCGLDSNLKKSNYYFIKDNLLEHIDVNKNNVYLINTLSDNCKQNADIYNELLSENQIDLYMINIGNNFNLGLNEPGTLFDSKTRVIELSLKQKEDIAELFDYDIKKIPVFGITQGIDNILNSKNILVVANGKEKAEGIKYLIKGKFNKDIPISAIKNYLGVIYIVADEEACSLL